MLHAAMEAKKLQSLLLEYEHIVTSFGSSSEQANEFRCRYFTHKTLELIRACSIIDLELLTLQKTTAERQQALSIERERTTLLSIGFLVGVVVSLLIMWIF